MKQDDEGDPLTDGHGATQETKEMGEDRFDEAVDEDDDEVDIDWLEPFTAEAPTLLGLLIFGIAPKHQNVALTKEDFDRRFSSVLERLGKSLVTIPSDVREELFIRALQDRKLRSAFYAYGKALQGDRFNEMLQFVRAKRKHMKELSSLLSPPRSTPAPKQLSEWVGVWIGSLQELAGRIEAQLRSGEEYMVQQQEWLRSGRSKIASTLLLVDDPWITKLIAEKKLAISNFQMLVAYGHASYLLSWKDFTKPRDPVKAMEMRISRAPHSKKFIDFLSLFLQMTVNLETKY